jgi:hypothetical protein
MINIVITKKELEFIMGKVPKDSSVYRKLWCVKMEHSKENANGLS